MKHQYHRDSSSILDSHLITIGELEIWLHFSNLKTALQYGNWLDFEIYYKRFHCTTLNQED